MVFEPFRTMATSRLELVREVEARRSAVRFLAKVTIPKEKGDEASKSGVLTQTIQSAMQRLRPEAAYFFEEEGNRKCLFVFNLDVVSLLKPLFPNLDASFHVTQVMNVAEFQAGKQPSADQARDLLTDIRPGASETQRPQAAPEWVRPEPLPSRPDGEPTPKPRTPS
jgi:hypothetical protein